MSILTQRLDNINYGDQTLNVPFSVKELDICINNSKAGKATGMDNIPNNFFKQPNMKKILLELFNLCLTKRILPSVWSKAIINPIPKSVMKDKYTPLNYWGLSLLLTTSELSTSLINKRLDHHLEWEQAGSNLHFNQCDQ